LATQPQVLLLDEPLAALDPGRKRDVFPWLERLRDELRIPMIYVTHSVDELTRLGDHLVVMDKGRVQLSGPVTETMSALDAQGVEGQDVGVLLDGQIERRVSEWHLAQVRLNGGSLWVRDDGAPVGGRVRLRVLARDVSLATQEPMQTSIQNHFRVVIVSAQVDAHPSQTLVKLRWGNGWLLARITRRAWSQLALEEGQAVWAQVKSVAVVH
jgi:molybdate transport system ATP-binding protein